MFTKKLSLITVAIAACIMGSTSVSASVSTSTADIPALVEIQEAKNTPMPASAHEVLLKQAQSEPRKFDHPELISPSTKTIRNDIAGFPWRHFFGF